MLTRIAIADDHQLVREGLKRIVATASDIAVTHEYCSGDELLEAQLDCDVLLTDLSMPGCSSIALIATLRAHHPELPILVVSMHNDAQIVRRALQAGATGYVDKGCTTDVLITAIRTVAARTRFIDPCLVDLLIQEARPTTIERHRLLSPREMEILQLLAAGHSGGDIAVRLHLSPKTVSTHKKRLMHKLGVDSVAALVKYALAHDLLQRVVAL
jgi:DNA-binding NarL/FixJ family response regulator